MPPTSAEFLAYTPEELWVEFFEDYYERNPHIELDESEDVQFVTGDPGIDKVEAMLAAETFDEEAVLAEIESWEKPAPAQRNREALLAEAHKRAEEHRKMVEALGDGFKDVAPGR